MAPWQRPLGLSLTLILSTMAAGLAVRYARLGLPPVLVKYGGSMLWALMVYWLVSTLLPAWRVPSRALLAGSIAVAVEFFKLCHSPGLDAFRMTLAGALLLGRFFSPWDIAAYWAAVTLGALADNARFRAEKSAPNTARGTTSGR